MITKKKVGVPEVIVKQSNPPVVPNLIYAQASPRSVGGVSLFEAQGQINAHSIAGFASEDEMTKRAVNRLRDAGFEILQVSPWTINIAGSAATYERAFNTKIVAEERPVIKPGARADTATFLDSPDTELQGLIATAGTNLSEVIEGVALEEPRYYMAPSLFAPLKSYWHLRLPGDVSLASNADKAHRAGITGLGISVAMVDSGHYLHPYFTGRGYRVAPVVLAPGAVNPLADEVGHGTGESANIFALAPDVQLLPVKMSFVNTVAAFNTAVGLHPGIITCSWGSSTNGPLSAADQALAAAIAAAVAAGITVVFSAGNGHAGFPGQHPDVISAGGVFMDKDQSLRASDYASGFMSKIYANRRVPDLCGLVGLKPHAIYIMLPLEAGDEIDVGNAGAVHPAGDETANNDGWAAFSGTSAAAPQLAGAAALVKQACSKLSPKQVKEVLMSTARDVTVGNCNAVAGTPVYPAGHSATPGADLATGKGLVDANKAVLLAKVKCLGPFTPITKITPITGITPITKITPITPITTITPITKITPISPITAISPPHPGPGPGPGPVGPGGGLAGGPEAVSALSQEDVSALEKLIQDGDLDLNA
jgi:subtilisin family serine protease